MFWKIYNNLINKSNLSLKLKNNATIQLIDTVKDFKINK